MGELLLCWATRWHSGDTSPSVQPPPPPNPAQSSAGRLVAGVTAEGTCLKEACSLKRHGCTPQTCPVYPKTRPLMTSTTA